MPLAGRAKNKNMAKTKTKTKTNRKSGQMLAYIMKLYKHSTARNLLKLSYLSDCLAAAQTGRPLTSFQYRRYSFGPFNPAVYDCLESLVGRQLIKAHANYTRAGLEFVCYAYNDDYLMDDRLFRQRFMPAFSEEDFCLARDILYDFFFYQERDLTAMIYKSAPMKALGATPGGLEGLGQVLPLSPA
jgi:hypothetical protein